MLNVNQHASNQPTFITGQANVCARANCLATLSSNERTKLLVPICVEFVSLNVLFHALGHQQLDISLRTQGGSKRNESTLLELVLCKAENDAKQELFLFVGSHQNVLFLLFLVFFLQDGGGGDGVVVI